MAYAHLAGLKPISGLYAASTPLFAYGIFGTSRQLSVGPVAIVSRVLFNGIRRGEGGHAGNGGQARPIHLPVVTGALL